MSTATKGRQTAGQQRGIVLWLVSESVGEKNWYQVFANNRREALRLTVNEHYRVSVAEYVRDFKPKVRRIRDDEQLTVQIEGRGEVTRTAKEWCHGAWLGPFCSNTYEI